MGSTKPKRVFLAINLSDSLKRELAEVVEELARKNIGQSVRWVRPENLHITLHFLGNKSDDEIGLISIRAGEIAASIPPFRLITGRVGCFPNERRPRVIMVETTDASSRVGVLVKKLGDVMLGLGLEIDRRPWHSHITLGRVKDGAGACRLKVATPEQIVPVRSFELMESRIDSDGSRYKTLKSFKLRE